MSPRSNVPPLRVISVNEAPVRAHGSFVLYWMIANRRHDYNFALQRAVEWAKELGRPLVVLEALRCDYPWASDRHHTFVLQGMRDNATRFGKRSARYLAYVEPYAGAGRGLLETMAADAAVVVTDDFPCFFLPRMVAAVAGRLKVKMEAVDANGLLPTRATTKVFARAHDFRRHLQREMPEHIHDYPRADPLRGAKLPVLGELAASITGRWAFADAKALAHSSVDDLPVDHGVGAGQAEGGSTAGAVVLRRFFADRLPRYAELRNQPDDPVASGLSPYLHFGHIGAHRVFRELAARQDWTPEVLVPSSTGKREGWWQMSPHAEAFVDQLITWREVGYNMCTHRSDYASYDSLPQWARQTLAHHANDPRPHVYTLEEFEQARTHDEVWNAAQTELVKTGAMHNYLRMLWGKKILEWTPSPREALAVMIELNNKYALDGRNPNSYSGIFWCLGRYDRAWGPQRPIFGKVRFMSSDSTRNKLRLRPYLARWSA